MGRVLQDPDVQAESTTPPAPDGLVRTTRLGEGHSLPERLGFSVSRYAGAAGAVDLRLGLFSCDVCFRMPCSLPF